MKILNYNFDIGFSLDRDADWEVDYYNETVPMSTYLVAFVVSDFAVVSNRTNKGIIVEVAGRPQAIENGDGEYALTEACKIIDYFVDYYNVSYALPKSSKAVFNQLLSRNFERVNAYFSLKAQIAIPDFGEGG